MSRDIAGDRSIKGLRHVTCSRWYRHLGGLSQVHNECNVHTSGDVSVLIGPDPQCLYRRKRKALKIAGPISSPGLGTAVSTEET